MDSVMFYTLAAGDRFDQALSFLQAVKAAAIANTRVGLLDGGLSPDQVAAAVAAGIDVASVPEDPGLAENGATAALLYTKYRAAEAWPLAERFLYCDCDCVFSRRGLYEWQRRALSNQGLLLVRQPVTWFHLLRSHDINDDQGLGGGLYEPVLCASMFGATRAALRALDVALRADLEKARTNGWRHWADEAGLARVVLNQAWRAQGHVIATLPAVWHWHAGHGWDVVAPNGQAVVLASGYTGGVMATPAGHLVQCLHFGAMGSAVRLRYCEHALPNPYLGRDGKSYGTHAPGQLPAETELPT